MTSQGHYSCIRDVAMTMGERTVGDHKNGAAKPNTFENIVCIVDNEREACG